MGKKAALLMGLGGAVFAGWLAHAAAQESRPDRANGKSASETAAVAGGEKIYQARCAICHFSASREKKIGPGLKDLSKRGQFAGGKKVDDEGLRLWIEKGGKNMPGFAGSLKPEEVRDLIAYLKSL